VRMLRLTLVSALLMGAAPSPAVVTGSFSATVTGAVGLTLKGTAVFEQLFGDERLIHGGRLAALTTASDHIFSFLASLSDISLPFLSAMTTERK
jgi:hypothetical protein